jgi:hypothetical protein
MYSECFTLGYMAKRKFTRYEQPFKCCLCGKLTLGPEGVSGPELCTRCYDRAGLENEHLDGGHSDEPRSNCPLCEEEAKATDSWDTSKYGDCDGALDR